MADPTATGSNGAVINSANSSPSHGINGYAQRPKGKLSIALTPLDHAPPKNYSCSLNYLKLNPGVTPEQAFRILQEGLHRTFVEIPWAAGRVWPQEPSTPGYRPGQLELRYDPVDPDGPRPYQIQCKELSSPLTYDEIKDAAFPTDAFKDETLIWAPFMPDISDGPEALVAQANFIPGGCVLCCGMFHAAADGVGGLSIFKLWADNCRALQATGCEPLVVVPPGKESSDRSQLERIWVAEHDGKPISSIDPGTWRLLGLPPPGTNSPQTKKESTAEKSDKGHSEEEAKEPVEEHVLQSAIFYIPSAKFAKLQRDCVESGGSRVSGTDAVVALIWRSSLRARHKAAAAAAAAAATAPASASPSPGDILNANAPAVLAVTVDGRPYFSQALPPTYMGNMTCINLTAMPLATLAAPDTPLSAVARAVRAGANSVTTQSLRDAYALARSVPDYGQLSLSNAGLDSTALLVSPLLTYPTNLISFGDRIFGNGGKIEALRVHMYSFNRLTRLCLVLPLLAAGGVEFLLNLSADEMKLLQEDCEFKRYALYLTN